MTTHIVQSSAGLRGHREGRGNVSNTFRALASAGGSIYRQYTRWARNRADRRRLMEMPDHMLKDIGIVRSEIDFAVNNGREIDKVRDFRRLPG